MTEQLPDSAEDLTGYDAPYPPLGCAALADAGPAQDGRGRPQDARTGAETATEPPEAATSPQAGTGGLHDLIAATILPVLERETAQLRRERDMALNTARDAHAAAARVRAYAEHAVTAGSNGPGPTLGYHLLGLLDGAGKQAA